jgi:hypothetical protein
LAEGTASAKARVESSGHIQKTKQRGPQGYRAAKKRKNMGRLGWIVRNFRVSQALHFPHNGSGKPWQAFFVQEGHAAQGYGVPRGRKRRQEKQGDMEPPDSI